VCECVDVRVIEGQSNESAPFLPTILLNRMCTLS